MNLTFVQHLLTVPKHELQTTGYIAMKVPEFHHCRVAFVIVMKIVGFSQSDATSIVRISPFPTVWKTIAFVNVGGQLLKERLSVRVFGHVRLERNGDMV